MSLQQWIHLVGYYYKDLFLNIPSLPLSSRKIEGKTFNVARQR